MIRKASKKEFLKFLRHKSVAPRLETWPDKVRVRNTYVVEDGEYRLYFFFRDLGKSTVEMHIGAIRDHRKKAVPMIEKALEFVKQMGYKKVITSAPVIYQSTINMAYKLGFKDSHKEYSNGYKCDLVYLKRVL